MFSSSLFSFYHYLVRFVKNLIEDVKRYRDIDLIFSKLEEALKNKTSKIKDIKYGKNRLLTIRSISSSKHYMTI